MELLREDILSAIAEICSTRELNVRYNDNCIRYRSHNDSHRDNDRPAVISSTNEKYWYRHGKIHRDPAFDIRSGKWKDRPACVDIRRLGGSIKWVINGKYHREGDRPAIIKVYGYGACITWFKHGQIHRDNDKPARLYPDGSKEWWVHDHLIKYSPR
jgi:hypothetical protein